VGWWDCPGCSRARRHGGAVPERSRPRCCTTPGQSAVNGHEVSSGSPVRYGRRRPLPCRTRSRRGINALLQRVLENAGKPQVGGLSSSREDVAGQRSSIIDCAPAAWVCRTNHTRTPSDLMKKLPSPPVLVGGGFPVEACDPFTQWRRTVIPFATAAKSYPNNTPYTPELICPRLRAASTVPRGKAVEQHEGDWSEARGA